MFKLLTQASNPAADQQPDLALTRWLESSASGTAVPSMAVLHAAVSALPRMHVRAETKDTMQRQALLLGMQIAQQRTTRQLSLGLGRVVAPRAV